MLARIVYVDLVGIDEAEALKRLLTAVKKERPKPAVAPAFFGPAGPCPPFPPPSAHRSGEIAGPAERDGPASITAVEESLDEYVVIHLDTPRQGVDDEYVVCAWLYQGGKPTRLIPADGFWPNWTKKNRADVLGAIWQAATDRGASPLRLVFEFVVPSSLLVEKIDHWRIAIEGMQPIKLGDKYPVVLGLARRTPSDRSHKQAGDGPACEPTTDASRGIGNAHRFLKDRWSALCVFLRSPCRLVNTTAGAARPAALWFADPSDGRGLNLSLSIDRGAVGCVALGRPLSGTVLRKKMNALEAVVLAGVPIILWPTASPKSDWAGLRDELSRLLDGLPLDGLPRRLFDRRAGSSEGGALDSLMLVWDDPARRGSPPDDNPPLHLEAR
jgi:hypothetical protein